MIDTRSHGDMPELAAAHPAPMRLSAGVAMAAGGLTAYHRHMDYTLSLPTLRVDRAIGGTGLAA